MTTNTVLFIFVYIIGVIPLVVSLIRYFIHFAETDSTVSVATLHPGGLAFLLAVGKWLSLIILLYTAYRLLFRRWKHHPKTIVQHKEDFIKFIYIGICMSALAGVAIRVDTNVAFIPFVCFYSVLYGILFELATKWKITLTTHILRNPIGILISVITVILCLLTLIALCMMAWQVSITFFTIYMSAFVSLGLVHFMLAFPILPGFTGISYFHVHHWYWSVILAHFCIFQTEASMIAQAIFLAIHIHGVSCFGMDPLFHDAFSHKPDRNAVRV